MEVGKCYNLLVCNKYLCENFLKILGYQTVKLVLHVWSTVLKKIKRLFLSLIFKQTKTIQSRRHMPKHCRGILRRCYLTMLTTIL